MLALYRNVKGVFTDVTRGRPRRGDLWHRLGVADFDNDGKRTVRHLRSAAIACFGTRGRRSST